MVQHVKLLKRSKVHNGFKFKAGLNVLKEPFNKDFGCAPGGFYYCKKSDIDSWIYLYGDSIGWLADVETPPDAQVVRMPTLKKLKADKIILSNFRKFTAGEWAATKSNAALLGWLRKNYISGNYSLISNIVSRGEMFIIKVMDRSASNCYTLFSRLTFQTLTPAICATFLKHFTNVYNARIDKISKSSEELLNTCLKVDGTLLNMIPPALVNARLIRTAVKQNPLASPQNLDQNPKVAPYLK